jgi:hypothetical protein
MSEWRGAKRPIDGNLPTPFELGNAGWIILHTAAAAFPNAPSTDQKNAMRDFIQSWSKVYACSHCAYHMRTVLATKPPVVENKRAVSRYICELHNDVNYMLGKDTYDCDPDVVLKRWHPAYPNMDDEPTIEEQIAASNVATVVPPKAGGSSRRWWGSNQASTTASDSSSAAPPRTGKVADSETDPAAVLARLKGCQVYCPEKDERKH